MNLIAWNRLGLRLSRLKGALVKEGAVQGFDWRIMARKAGAGLLQGLLGVFVAAAWTYFSDAKAVTDALHNAGVSDAVVALAVPLIVAGARAAGNYRKNANRDIVVPIPPSVRDDGNNR